MSSYFSPAFLALFLPLTVALYGVVPRRGRWVVLLAASYLFFWAISAYLIVFVLISTVSVYALGLKMGAYLEERNTAIANKAGTKKELKAACKKKMRVVLVLGLVLNLGILAALKYLTFFGLCLQGLLGLLGMNVEIIAPRWGVPIGISFYTLMAVSYLIDVYRETIQPDKHLGHVALFLCFFPQIMEGPIARYGQTGKKLCAGDPLTRSNLYAGFLRILWGLVKKMVVADRLNMFVERVYTDYGAYDGGIMFMAAVLYTIELYCDFSGTMDMAVGMGRLFNLEIPENFRQPFFSKTASEFWQRWHITLGAWLRDYIYYPISLSKLCKKLTSNLRKKLGNRYGPLMASAVALAAVWFGNGLWHGAGTQYLFFGLYYFVLIMLGGLIEPQMQKLAAAIHLNREALPYRIFQILRTWIIIFIGEMFFRANGLDAGLAMFGQMMGDFTLESFTNGQAFALGCGNKDLFIVGVVVIAMFVIGLLKERGVAVLDAIAGKNVVLRWALVILLIMVILVFGAYGAGYSPVAPMYAEF